MPANITSAVGSRPIQLKPLNMTVTRERSNAEIPAIKVKTTESLRCFPIKSLSTILSAAHKARDVRVKITQSIILQLYQEFDLSFTDCFLVTYSDSWR